MSRTLNTQWCPEGPSPPRPLTPPGASVSHRDRSEGLPQLQAGRPAWPPEGSLLAGLRGSCSRGVRCLALPGRWAASSSLVPGWCLKGSSFPGPCVCPGACPLSSAEKPFPNFNFIKRPCRDSVKTGCFSQGHRGDLGEPLTLPAGWPQSSRRWLAQAWVSPETPDCKTFIR